MSNIISFILEMHEWIQPIFQPLHGVHQSLISLFLDLLFLASCCSNYLNTAPVLTVNTPMSKVYCLFIWKKQVFIKFRNFESSQTNCVRTSLQRAQYSFFSFSVSAFQRWAKTMLIDFLETPLMCFICSLQNRLYPVLKSYTEKIMNI